jgi:hypothetical protein
MAEPEDFTLLLLRRIDEKLDRISDEMRDLKGRIG